MEKTVVDVLMEEKDFPYSREEITELIKQFRVKIDRKKVYNEKRWQKTAIRHLMIDDVVIFDRIEYPDWQTGIPPVIDETYRVHRQGEELDKHHLDTWTEKGWLHFKDVTGWIEISYHESRLNRMVVKMLERQKLMFAYLRGEITKEDLERKGIF